MKRSLIYLMMSHRMFSLWRNRFRKPFGWLVVQMRYPIFRTTRSHGRASTKSLTTSSMWFHDSRPTEWKSIGTVGKTLGFESGLDMPPRYATHW